MEVGQVSPNRSSTLLQKMIICSRFTSGKIVFCDNVQCDKKCDLLIQSDIKMVQSDKIVLNDAF